MKFLYAHTEDLHTETTSELAHSLSEWYIAIPLFFGLLGVLLYALKSFVGISTPLLINITLGILFVVGIAVFQLVPALSVIALSLGILGALLVVLSSL